MRRFSAGSMVVALVTGLGAACSASGGDETEGGAGGGGGSSASGATGGNAGTAASGGGGGIGIDAGGSGGGAGYSDPGPKLTAPPEPCTPTDPAVDGDEDGTSASAGDCNDCSRQIGPGAVDWPGNGVDEDCSGTPDDTPPCDTAASPLTSDDPLLGAAAIGLCQRASGSKWGVVSARYVKADGTPGMSTSGHGLLERFGGLTPREGASMLALSSGTARAPDQPGWRRPVDPTGDPPQGGADMGNQCAFPPGYPVAAQGCGIPPDSAKAVDSATLEVVLRVPTNANQFGFDFDFHSAEYPNWVCDQFNDIFATFFEPAPTGALFGNVSFDAQRRPIGVNTGLLAVCEPGKNQLGAPYPCPAGPSALTGTGYDVNAATGWITSSAYAPPGGELRVRFSVWDTGDPNLDSLVLVDRARFDVGAPDPATEPVR